MKGTVVMRFVGNRQEPEECPIKTSDILWEISKQQKAFDEWFEGFKQREIERMRIALQIPIRILE
jgi:hypothetical protein